MPPETPKPPRDLAYLFDIVDAMRHALEYVGDLDEAIVTCFLSPG